MSGTGSAVAGSWQPLPLCALAALGVVKVGLLLWIGPLTSPDTGGYTGVASAMQSGIYWGAIDLHGDFAAYTIRMAGYPAILALANWRAGASAFWVVAALQIALGMTATATLYRFAHALIGRPLPALLVAAAYATGLPLVFDQTILTDGAYTSILVIFLSLAGHAALRRRPLGLGRIFAIGLLPAAALMIREPTRMIILTMLPFLAVFAYAVRSSTRERMAVLAAVLLPLAATAVAYSAFNLSRTGSAFLTTALRTVLLVPLVQMQARGAPVFDSDDPMAHALKAEIKEWRNQAIYGSEVRAARRLGLSAIEMTNSTRDFFLRSIAEHPLAYAEYVLSELRPRYFALSLAPAASLGTLVASRRGELISVIESEHETGFSQAAMLFIQGVTTYPGRLCWLAMAAGLPILAAFRARRGIDIGLALLLALTAFHLALMLLFALVHVEARYLMVAQFVPPLALAYLVMSIVGRRGGDRSP
jgi:hypothetical protein